MRRVGLSTRAACFSSAFIRVIEVVLDRVAKTPHAFPGTGATGTRWVWAESPSIEVSDNLDAVSKLRLAGVRVPGGQPVSLSLSLSLRHNPPDASHRPAAGTSRSSSLVLKRRGDLSPGWVAPPDATCGEG